MPIELADIKQKPDYADFAKEVVAFNDIAGNFEKTSYRDLKNQAELIMEEAKETLEAFEDKDATEVLDGAIDVLYVTVGLLERLDRLGFKVAEAMDRTVLNNLNKFPMTEAVCLETVDYYSSKGIDSTLKYLPNYNLFVVKNLEGKVLKPLNFVRNNLKSCVPEGFTFEE